MIRKPVRWRRLGVATLASFAIAVTALAAQVSPPNAESPAQATSPVVAPTVGHVTPTDRKAITLENATLDRYVGTYQFVGSMLFIVKREGSQLKAQITGQPFVDIYPEAESKFFYKVVDAQLEFSANSGGTADSVTLFQNGQVMPMPRIDPASADQQSAELAAKIASQTATPGSEAALRRLSDGIASGKPNYAEMGPILTDAVKSQLSTMQPGIAALGALKTVTFRNVTGQGADLYLATYEKGTMAWRISLDPDGKIVNALVTPDF